jgi:lysophospholipase L1-like esterase
LVALGDSLALGRDDPVPCGEGWRGFVPRLADRLGIGPGGVTNTGTSGAVCRDLAADQLTRVCHLRPRLVIVSCGMNDLLARGDPAEAATTLEPVFAWAGRVGAAALGIALPSLSDRLPLSRIRRARMEEAALEFNATLAAVAERHSSQCLPRGPEGFNGPEVWSDDGVHLSSHGHALLAQALAKMAEDMLAGFPASTSEAGR